MNARVYLSMLKDQPEVLTVSEVAKILSIKKNKAYALVKNKSLSSIKVGGKIIVPKMHLIAFLLETKNYSLSPE